MAIPPIIVNEGTHEQLPSLGHAVLRNYHQVLTKVADQLTSVVVWTDSGMTQKVRETTLSYDGGGLLAGTVKKQYDAAGVLSMTLTSTITRDIAGAITSISVVKS